MTTMINLMKLTGLTVLYLSPAIIIAAILIVRYGNKRAKRAREQEGEYHKKYSEIEGDIIALDTNKGSKQTINGKFERLMKMPYKNGEMTSVLRTRIAKKFEYC